MDAPEAGVPVSITPFSTVMRVLKRSRLPDLNQILADLRDMRYTTQSAAILSELDYIKLYQVCAGRVLLSPEVGNGMNPIIDATLDAIHQVAPINRETMEMSLYDGGDLSVLDPECMGFDIGWNQWDEMTQNIKDYPDQKLYLFMTAIRMGQDEVITILSEHNDWDLEVDTVGTDGLDEEKLFKLFDSHKMSAFKAAWNICCYETGNIYFDYNPSDEDPTIWNLPSYSMEGIRWLEQQHDEAGPILADWHEANRIFKEPWAPQKLLWIFEEATKKNRKRRVSTLGEIWAETEEDDDPAN